MSKGLFKGKVVIEEETDDDRGKVTDQLNNSVAAIDIESRIVVEESLFDTEDEDETSNMSMTVEDDDTKPSNKIFRQNTNHGTKDSSVDDCGSEALDLSFIPCSIPLKKRKISSLPNSDNTLNEDKKKSDHHFHQKIITRDTSAFNQLTSHNRLNSFNLQSSHNHFPFTLRAIPSAASSSTSNCKPLSLVKNQQAQPPQQHFHHQNQLNFNHHYHQQQHQNQNNSHHQHQLQQQKLIQYQLNQQRQEFTIGNKSTGLGSSTSGQTKGMSCRRPGFITCSICNATKYYSHVQRRFGQYSCEPCSKFMKRFLRDPKIFTCSHKGHCTIGKPSGEQEPRGVSVNRCKACWLKICLEKFILDSETRIAIDKYYAPKFLDSADSPTSNDAILGGSGNVDEGSEGNTVNSEEGGETRLTGKSGVGEGDGETGKSLQSNPCDRIETNGCDTTISPPPLPFPQRKRKPKNELATPLSSSSTSSASPSSSSSSTPTNHINTKNTPTTGESIPLSTSHSGNHSRNKERHHQNQSQYHSLSSSSHHSDNRSRESLSFGHQSTGHLLTEPLCLTTGRRSDLFSSGIIGNLSYNSRSSSSTFVSDKHLGLTPLGPRYPWSHRRKDDYELTSPLTTQTSQNNLIHRGNDDDLSDIYHVDYSLNSPDLVLGGSFGNVSHFIKDMSGDTDVDDNFMVMGSPSTPPPPAARCGKCSYCLPTIDEKANVVVVKENCGPVRCRLAEIMSKSNQSLSGNKVAGDENGSGATMVTSTAITATSTTRENESNSIGGDSKHNKRHVSTTSEVDEDIVDEDYCHGSSQASKGQGEETVHSSTPISSLVNVNNTNNRRNRKDRRGHSKGVGGGGGGDGGGDKEESESDIGSQEGIINGDENLDQESRESNRDGYRKRFVSGDDDDQGVSMRFHGGRSSKSNKSVMFNKPYKKLLINEHFVNSSLINNQASNSNNHSNLLSTRDLAGSVISPDSNFLSEILNANSPFL